MTTPRLVQQIAMCRRRAKRHYLAMVRAERAGDWRRADMHAATLRRVESLENYLVDTAQVFFR